jgi:hypothetical protein
MATEGKATSPTEAQPPQKGNTPKKDAATEESGSTQSGKQPTDISLTSDPEGGNQ